MELTLDKTKPFLRWAGGKRWFSKYVRNLTDQLEYNNYHEPFLGSGAVFINLRPTKVAYLSDLNSELVETYFAVKDDVENVIKQLKEFKNTKDEYYRIRETKFKSDYKRAARFIYLNQTSFNGIYRVNLQNVYNVPYGYRTKNFYEPENLRAVSEILQKAVISNCDFDVCASKIKKKDLIFLDPPYTISHNNNGFIKYNQRLFSLDDQYRLSLFIDKVKKANAFYIMTNAAHKIVEEIFEKGDTKIKLQRASLIGGENAIRGKFEEIVFTNINLETKL